MSVRARLVLGFVIVTAVLVAPTLIATRGLSHLRRLAVEGRSGHAGAVAELGRLQQSIVELDRLERSFIATGDSALGLAAANRVASLERALDEIGTYAPSALTDSLGLAVASVAALTEEVSRQVHADQMEAATDTFEDLLGAFDLVSAQVTAVADSVDAMAMRDAVDAQSTSARVRNGTVLGLAIALVLTLLVAGATTHAMSEPLQRLGRASARIADGEFGLPVDLPYDRKDEIGELSTSFATMARRLQELDRTKAAFLGIVSHELKTPLNVIKAYAEVIEDELGEDISSSHRSLVNAMAEQALVMSRRVSRLMDISRLEAGAYRLSLEQTPIEDIAVGIERSFERQARDKGVSLHVRLEESGRVEAMLDVDIVREEILGNLILNALRFTPAGGTVEVLITGEPGGVVFTVTDSGPGIPEEHRPHIFDKYYVVDRARAVGSGLGLAIVKEMVGLHGGLVTLEASPPGLGARFRVSLPRLAPTAPAPAALELPPPELAPSSAPIEPPLELPLQLTGAT